MDNLYQSDGMISPLFQRGAVSAREQMMFQEYLANTAHQREMADLKAAGLNPILAANSGASVPTGSMDHADILSQTLAAESGSSGRSNSVNRDDPLSDLSWYDIFTAAGVKKVQAEGLSALVSASGITPADLAAGWAEAGGNVFLGTYLAIQKAKGDDIEDTEPTARSISDGYPTERDRDNWLASARSYFKKKAREARKEIKQERHRMVAANEEYHIDLS